MKQEGIDATLQVAEVMGGSPAAAIAEIAEKEGADAIVAGTRGYGALAGLLVASVTHQLLHIAHCPLLVVPSGAITSDELEKEKGGSGFRIAGIRSWI